MHRGVLSVLPSVAALVLLAACVSRPPLLDERTAPPYAGWVRRWEGLDRHAELVEAQRRGAPPLRVNVVAVQKPRTERGPLLVLQPGIMADHHTWRFIAPFLAEHFDLLLVDPPGTGASDKPDPKRNGPPVYTPGWIGRHTLRAVDRWQRARGDARPLVLVGHSLGSAAWLRTLSDPASRGELAGVCARISHLVLFVAPDVAMRDDGGVFEDIATVTAAEIGLACALGILDAKVDRAIYDSVVDPSRSALRQEAAKIRAALTDDRVREAAQAMLRRFRPLDAAGRPMDAAVRELAAREQTLTLPTLVLWGAQDDSLPPAMGRRVVARLPNARLEIIPAAEHSLHQERAGACAARVLAFLTAGAPRHEEGL